MIKAILRLAIISVLSIVFLATIFSFLRVLGLSTPYIAIDHPLSKYNKWVVVRGNKPLPESTKEVAYLRYIVLKDASESSLSQIKPGQFSWLYINTNKQTDHDKLIEYLADTQLEEKIVIHGPFKKSVDYIQKMQPRYLYVADPMVLNQLLVMDALYLESFASMKFDVVLMSTNKAHKKLKPKLLKEFARRQLRVVIELNDPKNSDYLTNKAHIKGFMTDRPDIIADL